MKKETKKISSCGKLGSNMKMTCDPGALETKKPSSSFLEDVLKKNERIVLTDILRSYLNRHNIYKSDFEKVSRGVSTVSENTISYALMYDSVLLGTLKVQVDYKENKMTMNFTSNKNITWHEQKKKARID